MDYIYKTLRGFKNNSITLTTKILIKSGFTIANDKHPYTHIRIIKDSKIAQYQLPENYCQRPLKAGDIIWFIYPDEYKEWCRGKTYAFIDDPHTIYYDGNKTCRSSYFGIGTSHVVDTLRYSYNDCMVTEDLLAYYNRTIIKVIFNDPATIVFWNDGTKTVVKCQEGDVFDKEKGLALCISKKYLGNKSNFNNEFKKWIVKENESYVKDVEKDICPSGREDTDRED